MCEAALGWFVLPYSSATSSSLAFMLDAPSGHDDEEQQPTTHFHRCFPPPAPFS